MKKIIFILSFALFFICSLIFLDNTAYASGDSCMFEVTADKMPPNIIFLLDNGVEMKHTIWHDDFDSSVDYTPIVGTETDVVPNGAAGNGFFNENGYSIFLTGGVYYLVPVGDDLELENKIRFEETGGKGSATWEINGKTITLPAIASSTVDGDGVKDNAGAFRYSKNYLNWLFFSGNYTGNGSDLSAKSRLYYAKKALLTVAKLSSNRARFAVYNFTSTSEGASRVQPIGDVVDVLGAIPEDNILDTNYENNINNMNTYLYSPLAEGLASIGGYVNSDSFGLVDSTNYCRKSYAIVVSAGMSSEDKSDLNQEIPGRLDDYDIDGTDSYGIDGPGQGTLTVDGVDHTIVTRFNGSTYLDDVAHYLYTHDVSVANDEIGGFQNVSTYTVGFMASAESRVFLINTSNNGNGYTNLTSSSHPEYGKYHFDAQSPDGLSQAILDAVNAIISTVTAMQI